MLCSKGYGVRKVYAFEPLQRNFDILEKNVSLNALTNVETHKVALGKKCSQIEIFHENEMANAFGYGLPEKVELRTIDSYNIKHVTLMKIDVEGFEMDLLYGARKTIEENLPKIIVETHSRNLIRSVTEYLSQLGYKQRHSVKNQIPKGRPEMDQLRNIFFSVD